jgi:hypothetical protein
MFWRRPKAVVCAECGKTIEPGESRFVNKDRVTKVERHAHLRCHKSRQPSPTDSVWP